MPFADAISNIYHVIEYDDDDDDDDDDDFDGDNGDDNEFRFNDTSIHDGYLRQNGILWRLVLKS